uniref:DUF3782 domain-containing protein n=1 Tax=Ignisphaera aggregans TaxID=334771 RepID=A0A7J3Z9A5_9CREN
MASSVDREKLKHEFLELLKSDEEFRLAVAGLIGYSEVLRRLDRHEEELKKLREDFLAFVREQEKRWEENDKKWEESNRRWEENWRRWEENSKRWDENNRRWEENNKRWEENNRRWEEAFRRFEAIEKTLIEHTKILEEHTKILQEHTRILQEHSKRLGSLEKRVSRIELELGALAEAAFAKFIYDDLEKAVREHGEKIVYRKRSANINGVEVDLLIESDKNIYIIEIKARPKQKHIDKLVEKAEAIQKVFEKPVKPILAGVYIGNEVELYAKNKGIEIYRY